MPRVSIPHLWAIFLVVFFLVACTSNPPAEVTPFVPEVTLTAAVTSTKPAVATRTPAQAQPTPTSTAEVNATALKGQNIVFWHPFTGTRRDLLAKLVAEFNATNTWGIQVQVMAWKDWADLEEQVRQLPVTKEQPDLLVGYNDQILRWDSGGYLVVDLNRYVNDASWGLSSQEQASYFPALWAQDYVPDGLLAGKPSQGGKRLGLPWYRTALVFFYNITWGRELGFSDSPRSSGEILSRACAGAAHNRGDAEIGNDGTGGWLITLDPGILASWIFAFGGEIARPDRTGYQFNSPQAVQAIEAIYQAYSADCVWRNPEEDPYQAFAQRRALLLADSLVASEEVQAAFQRFAAQDEWLILPFFSPTGEPVITVAGPALVVLQTNAERQLAAWLFSRWLTTPENQERWSRATDLLPVSAPAVKLLQENQDSSSTLAQAVAFLPYSHPEPVYASWTIMRWSLAEALGRLLVPGLSYAQRVNILENLDQLAKEIHSQIR